MAGYRPVLFTIDKLIFLLIRSIIDKGELYEAFEF